MKLKALIILTMLSTACFAQQKQAIDSLFIYRQDALLLQSYTQSAAQLIGSPVKQLSQAFINYQTADGHFRTSQQAEYGQTATFGTNGITTLGRFKLLGDFKFERSWQDSLAWTMQGVPDAAEPYYYFAGKAGQYQRLNYDLGGIITYQLSPKWHIASGLDYFYNTASRTVDPRPSVQTFHLVLKPELVHQSGDHTFSIGAVWGYEHEQNSIGYKNINYAKGTFYPDRINYLMMGYGYYNKVYASDMLIRSQQSGITVNYAYHGAGKYLQAGISYTQSTERNYFPRVRSENDTLLGKFNLEHYKFSLLAGKVTAHGRHQLAIDAYYDNGRDINSFYLGAKSNYTYQAYQALLAYTFQTRSNTSADWEWGVTGSFNNEYRRDISAGHLLDITYAEPGLLAAWYKKFGTADRLHISLSPSIRLPVNTSLQVPAVQINVFTVNIAYPDYNYWQAKAGRFKMAAEYVTPRLIPGMYSSIKLSGDYLRSFRTPVSFTGSNFAPSGSFFAGNVSFNLYF